MAENIKLLIKISRPRFWLYTAGPFWIGSVFALRLDLYFTVVFWLFLLYFLLPANIFLYGVNDLYDEETDALNKKKDNKEVRYSFSKKTFYKISTSISSILIVPLLFLINQKTSIFIIIFFVLSYFYSAKPIRFKSRPFLDFASNILYVMPGLFGYTLFTNQYPSISIIIAACIWTFPLHIFSAIPDIEADKKAGVRTTATFLGKRKSLILTSIFWTIPVIIAYYFNPFFILGLVYPILPLGILLWNWDIEKVYWNFLPYITPVLGFALFWYAVLR